MRKNIQEFIKLIEAQNNSISFDVDSYVNYKDSVLSAVLVLFKDKNFDEIIKQIEDEITK